MKWIFLVALTVLIFNFVYFHEAEAVSVSIDTEKETYYYGDYLTFIVTVDEVTGNLAILNIIDENGKQSSPIGIPISDTVTVQRAQDPFGNQTYPEGKWILRIEYEGFTDEVEFLLKDSGQLVFPIWFVTSGKLWANDQINENVYAGDIRKLIKENFIKIPNFERTNNPDSVKIPIWVKNTNAWWTVGLISDQEFANCIEFLIKKEIIVV